MMKLTNNQIIVGIGGIALVIICSILIYVIINMRTTNYYKKAYEELLNQNINNIQIQVDNYTNKIDSITNTYQGIYDSVAELNKDITKLNFKLDSINIVYEERINDVDTFTATDIILYLQSRYPEQW